VFVQARGIYLLLELWALIECTLYIACLDMGICNQVPHLHGPFHANHIIPSTKMGTFIFVSEEPSIHPGTHPGTHPGNLPPIQALTQAIRVLHSIPCSGRVNRRLAGLGARARLLPRGCSAYAHVVCVLCFQGLRGLVVCVHVLRFLGGISKLIATSPMEACLWLLIQIKSSNYLPFLFYLSRIALNIF